MNKFTELTTPPNEELFFKRNDPNDLRLGEIIPRFTYEEADIVILGCPQDEGVKRNNGRIGAKFAPDKIREQFYKLSNFGIHKRIHDIGNTIIQKTLEETHDVHTEIVSQILSDGKKIISLGGGNDLAYADGSAMAKVFGRENWIAINIDAHFDVRADKIRNSGTPYRQLLDENLLQPNYFYEIAFQAQANSPIYYEYLQDLGVKLVSLDQIHSTHDADEQLRNLVRQEFVHHSASINTFFGFDIDAIQSCDAPGTSAPSPIGLSSREFLTLVGYAANLVNTRIIEFTEVNPNFDVDDRTSKLVAIAMHKFCSEMK